jgi:hypothetical protein
MGLQKVMDYKFMILFYFLVHNILYYYINMWIIIVHDYVILKAFQVL